MKGAGAPRRVLLDLARHDAHADIDEAVRNDLSVITPDGPYLFAASDETATIERLTAEGPDRYGDHRTFRLHDLVDLPDAEGDRIYNGALDNSLGTASLLEIGREYAKAPATDRSVVFLAVTAEEKGLLGSEYYASNPLYPLATTAGVLYGLDKSFKAFTYFQLLLPIFAAAIVGGLGNPIGAVVGGFVIAFSEVTVTYAWKKVVTYLVPEAWAPEGLLQLMATDYKFAVSFAILIIVLLFRPTGIFKGQSV
jgi:hypothetical protein